MGHGLTVRGDRKGEKKNFSLLPFFPYLESNLPGEIWKPISSFQGYSVSNKGRIKGKSGLLKCRAKDGYFYCNLYSNSKAVTKQVHRIVATEFLGGKRNSYKYVPNHKDGNGLNNDVENLEWLTYSDNTKHAIEMGLIKFKSGKEHHAFGKHQSESSKQLKRLAMRGEKNHRSKLKENEIWLMKKILQAKLANLAYAVISKMFNISRGYVKDVNTEKTWRWV